MRYIVYAEQREIASADDVVEALGLATREVNTFAHELGCAVHDTERNAVMVISGWVQLPGGDPL